MCPYSTTVCLHTFIVAINSSHRLSGRIFCTVNLLVSHLAGWQYLYVFPQLAGINIPNLLERTITKCVLCYSKYS